METVETVVEKPVVEVSPEEAQKVLAEALKARVEGCSKEVEDVLRKYNCRIEVQQVLKVFPNQ